MHDLDRTQAEFVEEGLFESEPLEVIEELEPTTESPFNESDEIDLASQFLEVRDDAELDQFLGGLIKKAGKFVRSPVGRALGGILRNAARKALPVVGGALGSVVGGPVGGMMGGKLASMAGRYFGLEVEGLSGEDQDFEVARRFVRFAGSAAQQAAAASPSLSPDIAARRAVISAARQYAPGLLSQTARTAYSPAGYRNSGRWYRRGNKIVLYGVY